MKICEYENVRCPLCGEDEKLIDQGKASLTFTHPAIYLVVDMECHALQCQTCGGTFSIPCED